MRHAFALDGPHGPLTDDDRALLQRLALTIVARRMGVPALLFLNSMRPLNYIGSQAMTFLRPFLTPLFNRADYERLTQIFERRVGLSALADAIERAMAEKPGGGR
jgi:hypothetical protein